MNYFWLDLYNGFDAYSIILKIAFIKKSLVIYIYFTYWTFQVIIPLFDLFWKDQDTYSGKWIRFESVHHHIKSRTHSILFPLYPLFLFLISIVQSNKIHSLDSFGMIILNRVVSELSSVRLIKTIDVYIIIIKILLKIFVSVVSFMSISPLNCFKWWASFFEKKLEQSREKE